MEKTSYASSDQLFVRDLLAREEMAVDRFCREYGPYIKNILRRLLKNEEDAEDISQETLVQTLRKLDQFEERSKLRSWVHRIAVNQGLMFLRKKRKAPESSLEECLPEGDDPGGLLGIDVSPERTFEVECLLRRALRGMGEKQRSTLILKDYYGLEYGEVARHMGVHIGTTKSQRSKAIHYAQRRLKRIIGTKN